MGTIDIKQLTTLTITDMIDMALLDYSQTHPEAPRAIVISHHLSAAWALEFGALNQRPIFSHRGIGLKVMPYAPYPFIIGNNGICSFI